MDRTADGAPGNARHASWGYNNVCGATATPFDRLWRQVTKSLGEDRYAMASALLARVKGAG
ncbi:hypothetical protein [Amycolatopsis sp. NPDC006125]|uniref:hypothetical protein n=1 Tax=Amycolatopsis sp. NPDC006125 TaxID=3156730 RepID=UPI0033AD5A48